VAPRLLAFPAPTQNRERKLQEYARLEDMARISRDMLEDIDARKAQILAELVGG
jgi:hypothetical protein